MSEMYPLSMHLEDETRIVEDSIYGLCGLFHDLERRGISLNQRQAFMISFTDGSVRACALSPPEGEYHGQRITLDVINVADGDLSYVPISVYDKKGNVTGLSSEARGAPYLNEYVSWIRASISGAKIPEGVECVRVLSIDDETISSIIGFLNVNSSMNGTPHESN